MSQMYSKPKYIEKRLFHLIVTYTLCIMDYNCPNKEDPLNNKIRPPL